MYLITHRDDLEESCQYYVITKYVIMNLDNKPYTCSAVDAATASAAFMDDLAGLRVSSTKRCEVAPQYASDV